MHLHIYRKVFDSGAVACEEESVFGEDEWNMLLRREMEEVALWAHFIKKVEQEDRRVHFAETDTVYTIKSTAPVRKTINPDSSMVYALCCPIPRERYAGRKYFSKGETVFIPVPGWRARPVSRTDTCFCFAFYFVPHKIWLMLIHSLTQILFPPRIAPPFPGFQPSSLGLTAMEKEKGKGKEPANSDEHPTAQEDDFDYGAAVEEAFRTAERIEYVSPPLFPSHEEYHGDGREEGVPASSAQLQVQDEEERGDSNGNADEDEVEDESDYDDIFNDDWMVDESGNDLEANSDSNSDSDQPAADPDMPNNPADPLAAETPTQPQTPATPEPYQKVQLWTGTDPARQASEDSDSLFVPETQTPTTPRGSDDRESLFVPE